MTVLSPLQFIAEDKESRRQLLEGDRASTLPDIMDTARISPAPAELLESWRIEFGGKAVEIDSTDL